MSVVNYKNKTIWRTNNNIKNAFDMLRLFPSLTQSCPDQA